MGSMTVTNLGKAYKQYPNRWARLAEWLAPRHQPRHSLKWVMQDVNFRIEPGEAVGIVGVNGAGKSTLLKMITGTTQPTTGNVHTTGRVAALLELGMGFHPEFTGRQNSVMAGQLLGYSVKEVVQLMPQIEAFAEIGAYIDEPIRVYSSGMQMRLAFSVATARRPDVLIVDEALSVGDAYFQHKCFDRIREFRKQGTTLMIVSHDRQAIQGICDRAILLSAGRVAMEGEPEAVMDYYNAILTDYQNQIVTQKLTKDGRWQTTSGTGEAQVVSIRLTSEDGAPLELVDVGQPVRLSIEIEIKKPVERLILGYGIKDRLGQLMYGTNTDLKSQPLLNIPAGTRWIFNIFFNTNLGPGTYSVQTSLTSTDTHLINNYEWRDLALVFRVVNVSRSHFVGCSWIEPRIQILQA